MLCEARREMLTLAPVRLAVEVALKGEPTETLHFAALLKSFKHTVHMSHTQRECK